MIEYKRRNFDPAWNINEQDAPAINAGVTPASGVSRCNQITVMDIKEYSAGSCSFASGSTCLADGEYSVEVFNGVGTISYKWKIISGNVSFEANGTGGVIDDQQHLHIRSTGNKDEHFVVEVTVTDSNGDQTSKTKSFIHTRTQI